MNSDERGCKINEDRIINGCTVSSDYDRFMHKHQLENSSELLYG